jgi:hypothetical protein
MGQTEKGTKLFGISSTVNLTGSSQIGYSTSKRKGDGFETESQKTFNVNLTPRAGVFLIDNLAVGLDLNLGWVKITDDFFDGGSTTANQILASPFFRYYIPIKNVKPFIEAGAGIGYSKVDFEGDSPSDFSFESTSNLLSVGTGIGIATPLGNKVSFDSLIGYSYGQSKEKEDNDSNEKLITNTILIRFGFSIYL